MSISKQKNGTYRVQYYVKDAITLEKKKTSKRGFKTLKEAKEFEKQVNKKVTDYTFMDMYNEYASVNGLSSVTIKKDIRTFNKHFSYLINVRIDKVDKQFCNQMRSNLLNEKGSNTSKNMWLKDVKKVFNYAQKIYDIPNPTKVIKSFKETKKNYVVWSYDQYNTFENKLKEKYPQHVAMYHTMFYTGCRIGEILALTTGDLDLENKTIYIHSQVEEETNEVKENTKTYQNRFVRLDDSTFELLKPLKDNEKYLFGDYKHYAYSITLKTLKKVAKECGLPKITPHGFRHSHTSNLLSNGADLVATSKRLGHSTPSTTLKIYSHLTQKADDELMNILNRANIEPLK